MLKRYAEEYPAFEYDSPSERILRITFNKPETYNSLDAQGHRQLAYIWRDIDEDPDISCVILAAKGKAFSSGGDFGMIQANINNWNDTVGAWKEARDLVYNIINCSKPIISAVNGVAVGAGLVAALLADISIIAKSARVLDGHVRLGVAAGDVACINWVILAGMAKAKYHLLTNEPVFGEEAERMGLFSLCTEDDALTAKSEEVAATLANGAPNAIRWTKLALNNWYRMAMPTFENSLALEMLGFKGPEAKEGLASFLEKREPSFDPNSPL
ncbi:MAG: enoyl-CoA hydratase/isomerase family protein [Alphaproteobacteria bacterium]|jgi:enoyl-CoA hydratase|nr:enoyl-CoA hydratase/isomerase family protein [Alphaproteobacteria bacterium]